TAVEPNADRVTVGPRSALTRRCVTTGPLHPVDLDADALVHGSPYQVEARIRHAQAAQPATLTVDADLVGHVVFDEPVFAPAPGQALVAYRGEAVLAGAPIVRSS